MIDKLPLRKNTTRTPLKIDHFHEGCFGSSEGNQHHICFPLLEMWHSPIVVRSTHWVSSCCWINWLSQNVTWRDVTWLNKHVFLRAGSISRKMHWAINGPGARHSKMRVRSTELSSLHRYRENTQKKNSLFIKGALHRAPMGPNGFKVP